MGVGPVASILDNRVCLGQMAALRTTSLSCKNKELIHKPENEQVLVENSHGPLIAPEQWDIVQNMQAHRERFPKHMAEPALFPNRCSALPAANRWSCTGPVRRKNGSTTSSAIPTASGARQRAPPPHRIREFELTRSVLDDLRRAAHFARIKERRPKILSVPGTSLRLPA